MSEEQNTTETAAAPTVSKAAQAAAAVAAEAGKLTSKKKLHRLGKKKTMAKIRADQEFAKTYFEAKRKRSADKKSTFRKKKSRKK